MDTLKQAKALAEEILGLTKSFVFADEDESNKVESYNAMLDEREPLIDELTDLKNQMDDMEDSSVEFTEINKIIDEIAEINKKHVSYLELLQKNAQSSYKEIKQGQRIHAGYNPLPGNEVSNKIDIKN